jgi:hypothetical protein
MGLVWADGDQIVVGAGIPGPDWVVWRAYSRVAMLAPLDACAPVRCAGPGVALGLALALMLYLGWQLSPGPAGAAGDGHARWRAAPGFGLAAGAWRDRRPQHHAAQVALALADKDGENRQLFEQLEG